MTKRKCISTIICLLVSIVFSWWGFWMWMVRDQPWVVAPTIVTVTIFWIIAAIIVDLDNPNKQDDGYPR